MAILGWLTGFDDALKRQSNELQPLTRQPPRGQRHLGGAVNVDL
jgi:hypothetical protein